MAAEPIPAEAIDFTHPNLAIRCSANRLLVSYDRCRSWRGPYLFPDFGFSEQLNSAEHPQQHIAATIWDPSEDAPTTP